MESSQEQVAPTAGAEQLTAVQPLPVSGALVQKVALANSLAENARSEETGDSVTARAPPQKEVIKQQRERAQSHHSDDVSIQEREDPLLLLAKGAGRKVVELQVVRLGICAMNKKVQSKPMREILKRVGCPEIEIIVFEEEMILKKPVASWPVVDALISYYSTGFPLRKTQEYARLTKPFLINDLKKQEIFWDRRNIYDILKQEKIPTPKHHYVVRNTKISVKKKYIEEEKNMLGELCQQQQETDQHLFCEQLSTSEAHNDQFVGESQHSIRPHGQSMHEMPVPNAGLQRGSHVQECESAKLMHDTVMETTHESQEGETDTAPISNNENNIYDARASIPKYKSSRLRSGSFDRRKLGTLKISNNRRQQAAVGAASSGVSLVGEDDDSPKPQKKQKKNLVATWQKQARQNELATPSSSDSALLMLKKPSINNAQALTICSDSSDSTPHNSASLKRYKAVTKIEELDDYLVIEGQKLRKPFLEKPMDAENHNIWIYYPTSDGGGCKKLFRKLQDISSNYDKNINSIRNDGNYIYEEFLPTNGFDIKVYCVGDEYAHAEARKSPVLDGKVQREQDGKEMRYPVTLTPEEKMIAKKIVRIFGQNVVGFDVLRSQNKSYVCDVNGWSFVKGNKRYYEDCALTLRRMLLQRFAPSKLKELRQQFMLKNTQYRLYRPLNEGTEEGVVNGGNSGAAESLDRPTQREELRSVVAIFRHGDRTPKQKMKMKVKHPLFYQFYIENCKDRAKELKVKSSKQLQALRETADAVLREQLAQQQQREERLDETNDDREDTILDKLVQMVSVMEIYGNVEGVSRKVQIRPLENETLLFIVKWGGDLTHSGEQQAEQLGEYFRHCMYQQSDEGIIRLHNTYRHDLKTYASDEARCQKTAAHFLMGMLGYEGSAAPIIATMLTRDETAIRLLDISTLDSLHARLDAEIKDKIDTLLNSSRDLYEHFMHLTQLTSVNEALEKIMREIGNPKEKLQALHQHVRQLAQKLFQQANLKYKTYYIRLNDFNNAKTKQMNNNVKRAIDYADEHHFKTQTQRSKQSAVKRHSIGSDNSLKQSIPTHDSNRIDDEGGEASILKDSQGNLSFSEEQYERRKKQYRSQILEGNNTPYSEENNASKLLHSTSVGVVYQQSLQQESSVKSFQDSPQHTLEQQQANQTPRSINELARQNGSGEDFRSIELQEITIGSREVQRKFSLDERDCPLDNVLQKDSLKDHHHQECGKGRSPLGSSVQVQEQAAFVHTDEWKGCGSESISLIYKRWRKLRVDFYDENRDIYNISKIPDIFDNIKYDLLHNQELILKVYGQQNTHHFYNLAALFASFVVPNESGLCERDKIDSAVYTVDPLCKKIKMDLIWWKMKTQNMLATMQQQVGGSAANNAFQNIAPFGSGNPIQQNSLTSGLQSKQPSTGTQQQEDLTSKQTVQKLTSADVTSKQGEDDYWKWIDKDNKKSKQTNNKQKKEKKEDQLERKEESNSHSADTEEDKKSSEWRHVRTRLYFTSASHIYALFNIIHLGLESMLIEQQRDLDSLQNIKTLQYLSYLVIRLYEDLNRGAGDDKRFRLELQFSPGCQMPDNFKRIKDHMVPPHPPLPINSYLNIHQVEQFFDSLMRSETYDEFVQSRTKTASQASAVSQQPPIFSDKNEAN